MKTAIVLSVIVLIASAPFAARAENSRWFVIQQDGPNLYEILGVTPALFVHTVGCTVFALGTANDLAQLQMFPRAPSYDRIVFLRGGVCGVENVTVER